MATYIKIRELNPYADPTGVFSGDMLALSLDTTTVGTPHSSQATQRATVEQVINSYNTSVANQSSAARAAGDTTINNITVDSNGNLTQDQTLTAATFGDFIEIGGGLEWNNPCMASDGSFIPNCDSKPTLSLASSTESVNFNLVVSGGAVPPSEYKITPGVGTSWVSGRFPTLKEALVWQAANISNAENINFLICNDLDEGDVIAGQYNLHGSNITHMSIEDYGLRALAYEVLDARFKPDNNNPKWAEGYLDYKTDDIVLYTGKNDGTVGDYNYYRCISNNANVPLGGAGWERLTPAGSPTLGGLKTSWLTGELGDPNGFSSIGFTSRPTININQLASYVTYNPILSDITHNGATSINGIKLKITNLNSNSQIWTTLFRKQNGLMTIGNSEIHLEGKYLPQVFESYEDSNFRITRSSLYGGFISSPDIYNVTGARSVDTTMPSLYLDISGLLGKPNAGTGIGTIMSCISSIGQLGTEYSPQETRNGTFDGSRLQIGSGQVYMTACMVGKESSTSRGNVSITKSPTTTFSPGGVPLLNGTGYSSATHQGLGNRGAAGSYAKYPGIAPIAASQFFSNSIVKEWRSGDGSVHDIKYISNNATSEFMSGDAFMSSREPGYPKPATASLPVYERYPD